MYAHCPHTHLTTYNATTGRRGASEAHSLHPHPPPRHTGEPQNPRSTMELIVDCETYYLLSETYHLLLSTALEAAAVVARLGQAAYDVEMRDIEPDSYDHPPYTSDVEIEMDCDADMSDAVDSGDYADDDVEMLDVAEDGDVEMSMDGDCVVQ
ncbi:MAG: hypothetical protein LQ340_003828 [Diploschistes diacapsis]|nr:MAG: hypothetical protein LQ340_003828 [Diploschistes diacapsis]